MIEQAGDYDRRDWAAARSARRFECGSPNMLGIHGLHASLSLLLEVGMRDVSELALKNSSRLIELIDDNAAHLELLSDRDPGRRSGIVTFRHRRVASPRLYQMLRDRGINCAQRGGGIRYSPHFYTREDAMDQALRLAVEAA
jgi:selenocysteine lyase/cysteine desulfurase